MHFLSSVFSPLIYLTSIAVDFHHISCSTEQCHSTGVSWIFVLAFHRRSSDSVAESSHGFTTVIPVNAIPEPAGQWRRLGGDTELPTFEGCFASIRQPKSNRLHLAYFFASLASASYVGRFKTLILINSTIFFSSLIILGHGRTFSGLHQADYSYRCGWVLCCILFCLQRKAPLFFTSDASWKGLSSLSSSDYFS
ncbi:hypothetical protein BDW68DRAFT_28783 [Aspergillus falconensis]